MIEKVIDVGNRDLEARQSIKHSPTAPCNVCVSFAHPISNDEVIDTQYIENLDTENLSQAAGLKEFILWSTTQLPSSTQKVFAAVAAAIVINTFNDNTTKMLNDCSQPQPDVKKSRLC